MTAQVFDLVAHQTKRQRAADIAYLSQVVAAPSYMALPFLTKDDDPEAFGYAAAKSYWNDTPTDDPSADYRRGTAYAKMAINALASDRNLARGLELTLEHIFLDAVRRREARGKYSRSLSFAARGFLDEIASHVNGSVGGYVPA